MNLMLVRQILKFDLSFVNMQGHEDRYSIYVHASRENPVHVSPIFMGRDIRSAKVCNLRTSYNFQFLFMLIYIYIYRNKFCSIISYKKLVMLMKKSSV